MAFKFEKNGPVIVMTCTGSLDAERAQTLRDALMVGIENADNLVVNCESVDTIHSHCVEVFCLSHRIAVRAHKKLLISNISPDILKLNREEIKNLCSSHSSLGCNNNCLWASHEASASV
ncbi:MAG: STAS domain-containing protein [Nitrospirae bacterium]|nr:STAS domain-containing protein [Nitrospirota bacterium]